MMVGQSWKV